MNNFFAWAFAYLMQDESTEFVNDPLDSGGPTKFGITQKTFEHYFGRLSSTQEIKDMTIDVAKEIYYKNYWLALKCDKLISLGVSTALFNSGALYGVKTTTLYAQDSANKLGADLKVDGIFGDKTADAINMLNSSSFLDGFHEQLMARIDTLCETNPKNERFRKGWTKRADRLLALSNASLTKTV